MNQQQHRYVGRDQVHITTQALDMEQLADLLQHHPRRRRLLCAHVEATGQLQSGQHTDHRQFTGCQALHQAADFVFEELLLIQREERNDLRAALGVGSSQTEVDLVAALVQRYRLQAELGRAVLLLGKRLRVDHVQLELAAGSTLIGLEHLLDTTRVVTQRYQVLGGLVRIEEVQFDRRLQAIENALGPLGDGVELLLGQIEPGIGQERAGKTVERQEGQRDQQQPGTGIDESFHVCSLRRLSSDRRPPQWPPARRRSA